MIHFFNCIFSSTFGYQHLGSGSGSGTGSGFTLYAGNPDPQHWIKDPATKSLIGTFRQFIDFARVLAGEPKGVVCEFVL
jgi:hypothetical protein